jgi:hypothetical protein
MMDSNERPATWRVETDERRPVGLTVVGEGQGGWGFQHVRYTAIARRPAAQGESTAHSARGTFATTDKPALASWGAGVRWRDRTGVFHRDLGDDEYAEIVIADRTYRVRIADLA